MSVTSARPTARGRARDLRALQAVREGHRTVVEVAVEIGLGPDATRGHLARLVEHGLVEVRWERTKHSTRARYLPAGRPGETP